MTTPKAFLAAIRETPEDDVPRLVYADWLEDNGDPERAEFIRAQCELARLRDDEARAFDLRWRQDELLANHGSTWREEVPAWARKDCTFRRGFVDRVQANITKFIQSGKGLSRTVPVREAILSADPTRVAALANCPHLASLTSLYFRHATRDAGAIALAGSEHLRGLQRLHLANCAITDEGATSLAASPHLRALTELDLSSNEISGAAAAALLDGLPRLTSLSLTNTHDCRSLDGEGLHLLLGSKETRRLERLTIDAGGLDESSLASLAARPACLRALGFEHGAFEEGRGSALVNGPGLANLEELSFSQTQVDSSSVKALATSSHLARLRKLVFASAGVDDECLFALARSPHLAGLTTLRLWNNHCTERGIQTLLASPHLTRLLDLELNHNDITAPVAAKLVAASSLAGLRRLSLSVNGLEEGIEYFCESLRTEQFAILELNYNEIDDDGATALAECAALSNLRILNLAINRIGDAGAIALARSPFLARLQQLDLCANTLHEAGMLALASSPSLANVISLNLRNNATAPTSKAKAALKDRFGDRVLI